MSRVLYCENMGLAQRLRDFSFSIEQGDICHFIGRNGSGKTTALSMLSGLITPEMGKVYFQGKALSEWSLGGLAQTRGYLIQQERPPFTLSVIAYWQLVVSSMPWLAQKNWQAVAQSLSQLFSLDDKWQRSVTQLSGGEWQRVRLVASCLQIHPDLNPHAVLWLLDEPTSALDVAQEGIFHQLVKDMANRGLAVIVVNHDLNRTLQQAKRVCLFDQGRCVAQGETLTVMSETNLTHAFQTPIQRIEIHGRHGLWFTDPQI